MIEPEPIPEPAPLDFPVSLVDAPSEPIPYAEGDPLMMNYLLVIKDWEGAHPCDVRREAAQRSKHRQYRTR